MTHTCVKSYLKSTGWLSEAVQESLGEKGAYMIVIGCCMAVTDWSITVGDTKAIRIVIIENTTIIFIGSRFITDWIDANERRESTMVGSKLKRKKSVFEREF